MGLEKARNKLIVNKPNGTKTEQLKKDTDRKETLHQLGIKLRICASAPFQEASWLVLHCVHLLWQGGWYPCKDFRFDSHQEQDIFLFFFSPLQIISSLVLLGFSHAFCLLLVFIHIKLHAIIAFMLSAWVGENQMESLQHALSVGPSDESLSSEWIPLGQQSNLLPFTHQTTHKKKWLCENGCFIKGKTRWYSAYTTFLVPGTYTKELMSDGKVLNSENDKRRRMKNA